MDMLNKPILISAHPKKVVLLFNVNQFPLVVRASAVNKFPFGVKTLAAIAIMAPIFAKIDISLLIDPVEDVLDDLDMVRIGGSDKVIV